MYGHIRALEMDTEWLKWKKSLKSNDLQRIRCRQYKTLTTTREQKNDNNTRNNV